MRYVVLQMENGITKDHFVNFWSNYYYYDLEKLYSERIDKKKFSIEDLHELFRWKNGGNLSEKKRDSLEKKILKKLEIINNLKQNFSLESFLAEFENISTIWKIFLLHIIVPKEYPIFDQHVGRAFCYLTESEMREVPISNVDKEILYFEKYVPFFRNISSDPLSQKKVDEALWAFGKFLKSDYAKPIVNGGKMTMFR